MNRQAIRSVWQWLAMLATGLLVAAPGLPVFAITYNSGTYGACQYGACSISIASNGTLSVDVTPSGSGSCTVQKDTVSVLTSNSAGYSLTSIDSSTNTNLVNAGNSISAISASQTSPAALSANKWGYRVDGIGTFGAGPTSVQTNATVASISSITFAGIPASSGTVATLASTAAPASPAVTTSVWYGVCANTSVPSGTYTTQITYTAITN